MEPVITAKLSAYLFSACNQGKGFAGRICILPVVAAMMLSGNERFLHDEPNDEALWIPLQDLDSNGKPIRNNRDRHLKPETG